jgi:hypothetical protein
MGMLDKKGVFYRVRVAILLSVLLVVVLYAAKDVWRRRVRKEWRRPLGVALVIVREGAVEAPAISALRHQARALETRLREQLRRYRPGGMTPFEFTLYGPVDMAGPAPQSTSDDLVDLARHAWNLHRFVSDLDERAGVPASGFDACVYLVSAPLALFVATHELFHTLGATDKYDAAGRLLVPSGLAEPELSPRYPQHYAEIMARNRAVAPGVEEPPANLTELAVGSETAAEIGWTAP